MAWRWNCVKQGSQSARKDPAYSEAVEAARHLRQPAKVLDLQMVQKPVLQHVIMHGGYAAAFHASALRYYVLQSSAQQCTSCVYHRMWLHCEPFEPV
jgi:hypothetical protein